MQEVDIDALVRGRRGRRPRMILVLLLVVAAVSVLAWYFTRSEEEQAAFEPQRITATSGQLTTTVELSGSATAAQTASLSFAAGGEIDSVEAEVGDEVQAGDILARLKDEDAQRSLETALVQLELAVLKLEELQESPTAAQIAAAERALANAEAQLFSAALRLEQIHDPPDQSVIDAAEQSVANALTQVSNAEQALTDLTADVNPGDLAQAQQQVANAAVQLSNAEQALTNLGEGPSDNQIASAEQAVANAAAQLSSAEQTLAALTERPSVADLESARAAAIQARAPVNQAESTLERSEEALEDAQERFCDDITILPEICASSLPLSDADIETLRSKLENSGSTLERRSRDLVGAQEAWEEAIDSLDAASASLLAAEARLSDLNEPDPERIEQATEAVTAARAARRAADAGLEDLLTPASEADIFQAEQSVAAARAGLTSAEERLRELLDGADPNDIYQAQQALTAAREQRDAAQAQMRELLEPPTEDDIQEAELALASAQSAWDEAQANYDQLIAGPTATAIAQQEQNVRLAEITYEQALDAMDDLLITATFDGTVEAVNVSVGDRISAGATVFVVSTRDQVVVNLTVTEAEIFDLRELQVGVASFDAIEGAQYPVRITTINRVPNVDQGVVTYAVEATVLAPLAIQAVRDDLEALGVTVPERQPAAQDGQGAGGQGAGLSDRARRFGAMLQSLDLPEGTSLLQVVQAIANDDPLPEGVELPEEFDITDAERAQLRPLLARFTGSGGGAAGGTAAVDNDRQLPIDGMSATVTVLTAVRDEAVLISTSAVRQIDGAFYVAVPTEDDGSDDGEDGPAVQLGWERLEVQIGESDGTNVEILSGLEEGVTVLVGVDSEGVAYNATQLPGGGTGAGALPGPLGGRGGG
ncbi:MAG: HlyD family efflux transporter periplasmic adaptor subunit [Chloroflexi bacterium]|nr:HlyD family efflux transporter periplasmic adaptor subunit [Chloroflexota bacterium]MCY3697621.1 HlyD family efflux transporter periplasmic adaptor subunit [Chloroflexota bacterium]